MSPPAKPPRTWKRTLKNQLPDLMRAIDELDGFLQSHACTSRATYIARLAVEEFGTNILKYGYDDTAEHNIDLRARIQADQLQVELIDDGHSFDPTTRQDPSADLSLDERAPGGWGISLVKSLAQSVRYQRRGARNLLTVTIDRHSQLESPANS